MAVILLNKNKYAYNIKSKIRKRIYQTPFLLRNYLKLKEIFIKADIDPNNQDVLFRKIFIETISYCNNDCVFCPASIRGGAKSPGNLMPESLYIKILNELAEIDFTGSIAFHCNNEPLLDTRLASWIKKARGLLKNNFFYLYTNGSLIDVELANELFEAGLNRIIISNYSDNHKLIPSVRQIVDNSDIIRGEIIIKYRLKADYLGNRAGEVPNAKNLLRSPLKIMCLRPSTEIVIGYDGTVPLCCADGLWKVILGDVKNSSLKDIWRSGYYREVRGSLAKADRNCAEICKVCDALNFPAPKGIRE